VLSGGERNRLSLLKLLLRPANLLILDEPTNHLDMNSKDVLLEALREFTGTVVFVSHDRYFIDGLATKVLELRAGEPPRLFPGNYEYYLYRAAEEAAEESSGKSAKPPAKTAPPPGDLESNRHRNDRDEAKRSKAETRRRQKREEEILELLEVLETQHREKLNSLSLPEVYADGEKVKRIKDELDENETEQARLHEEWERLDESS
jgi:ATP-binding cassette subfamily F protein 3